jgi:hypothetical protein
MKDTVNILGKTYTLRRVPWVNRDSYRAGEIRFEKQEIAILDTLQDDATAITILHEVVHGILNELKFLTKTMTKNLYRVLRSGFIRR